MLPVTPNEPAPRLPAYLHWLPRIQLGTAMLMMLAALLAGGASVIAVVLPLPTALMTLIAVRIRRGATPLSERVIGCAVGLLASDAIGGALEIWAAATLVDHPSGALAPLVLAAGPVGWPIIGIPLLAVCGVVGAVLGAARARRA